jgi:hypothetical protein
VVGSIVIKQAPDFGSRNYGYAQLSDLIHATGLFDLDWRKPAGGKSSVVYTRDKRYQPAKSRPE